MLYTLFSACQMEKATLADGYERQPPPALRHQQDTQTSSRNGAVTNLTALTGKI